MLRKSLLVLAVLAAALILVTAALADSDLTFPDLILIPNGFQPEGITTGKGSDFYVGSLVSGSIYEGDLRTGQGQVIYTPDNPRNAVGLSFDARSGYLFIAGGGNGDGLVLDTKLNQVVQSYDFGGGFVNDVIVTREAAYFTDSFAPFLYKVDLGPGGSLASNSAEAIPLSGDYQFEPGQFNANGIVASPDGRWLLLINSFFGELYKVNPADGTATLIDLGGADITSGDGLWRDGYNLYVVRNFLNQIAVLRLAPDYSSGESIATITDPEFKIPTTAAGFGDRVYAVNARFDVAPPGTVTPDLEFQVVGVDKVSAAP